MMVQMASSNTLIQAMVPDHLRGRVMSVYSMMFMGMAPFGALSAGAAGASSGRAVDGGAGRSGLYRGGDLVWQASALAFAPRPASWFWRKA